jgi:M6 family metalloprotease-like protein
MKKIFTVILLMFVIVQQTFAIPAYPYPIDFKQPDGDEVTVMIKGDERLHWHESMDGYSLLFNQDGYLTYAVSDESGNLQPSDFIAVNIENRDAITNLFLNTIEKKLFYSDVQQQLMLKVWEIEDEFETRGERALTGNYKTLCAFVQFPDKPFTKTISQFEGLMNQLGYTGNGTGSVRDFFKETSYNKFDLTITLCGNGDVPYTAPQNESYYAGNNGTAKCSELTKWLAQQVAANSNIDFADYCNTGGKQVNGFHFIFAGRGQEAGGGKGTIWSHKSNISPVYQKDKYISVYSCSPELLYSNITTIGVICHEMTHVFGAPDFYDTNYDTGGQYDGTGQWDIMADGSWNANGNRPAHHNMYTKIQFGWVTPTVLNSPLTITNMPNSAENPVAYRINTATNNEYYLLENRQKIKFDASVPGSGLLIYHVHSSVGSNCINCTHPQKMYPVCASSAVAIPTSGANNYGNINSSGCPFPGSSNKTSFDGTSTPRMFRWTNTAVTDKPITEITHNSGKISFKFMGGNGTTQYSVDLSASPVNSGTVTGVGTYDANAQVTVEATPNAGFSFFNWTKNGTEVTKNPKHTFTIMENTTFVANFKSNNANLNSLTVSEGTLTPDFDSDTTNYSVDVANSVTAITITGVAQDANATVSGNVTDEPLNVGDNDFTITVTAQDNSTKEYLVTVIRAEIPQYTIISSVEDNIGGTISPEGTITIDEGEDIIFEMIPDDDYIIEYVLVDGEDVGTDTAYTFENITSDHIIVVKFKSVVAIETVETQQVRIFPNPTTGELSIEMCDMRYEICDIEIFDIFGKKVSHPTISHPISTSHLPSGIYFLRITTETGVITKKIVKQ